MKNNILSFLKTPKFIIVTLIYMSIIIPFKLSRFSSCYFYGVSAEKFIFSNNLGIFLIPDIFVKTTVLFTIILLSIPTFIYIIFIIVSYYHYSFELSNEFIFLRISRTKKLINFYIEIFVLFSLLYIFQILYQILILFFKYDLNLNLHIFVIDLCNTLFFYTFIIVVFVNLNIKLSDWWSSTITLILLLIFSYGNYFLYYPYILNISKRQGDENFLIERIHNKVFSEYMPTHMNVLYQQSVLYGLFYLILILILILFSFNLFIKIDIEKEVIE